MEGDAEVGPVEALLTCFDPRPRMEGDVYIGAITHGFGEFRSTPPHGGRLLHVYITDPQ